MGGRGREVLSIRRKKNVFCDILKRGIKRGESPLGRGGGVLDGVKKLTGQLEKESTRGGCAAGTSGGRTKVGAPWERKRNRRGGGCGRSEEIGGVWSA